jgi:hypothetical protein
LDRTRLRFRIGADWRIDLLSHASLTVERADCSAERLERDGKLPGPTLLIEQPCINLYQDVSYLEPIELRMPSPISTKGKVSWNEWATAGRNDDCFVSMRIEELQQSANPFLRQRMIGRLTKSPARRNSLRHKPLQRRQHTFDTITIE